MKEKQTWVNGTGLLGLAIASLLVASQLAQAQTVRGSRHDLSLRTEATTEVCVFCHTPHGSNDQAQLPLWNKPTGNPAAYTLYSSSTLRGQYAEGGVGSVSLACLSCHDGTQAMDTVVNLPGNDDGSRNPAGVTISGGQIGQISGGARFGTDLSREHPISIQYGGGGCDVTNPNATCQPRSADFQVASSDPSLINGVRQWWVDTGATNQIREKTDMILYTRSLNNVDQPFVECGSCHDPHNAATGGQGSGSVSFLRIPNASSEVCLSCHIK